MKGVNIYMSLSRSFFRFLLLPVVLSALSLVLVSGPASAQVPMRTYDSTLTQMLDSLQTKSYDQFIANGDEKFKSGFTAKMFDSLANMLGPRLHEGYALTFLTTLRQEGYLVYVWKLSFKDGKSDFLINMATKDGNVSGFITR
jgi:hypothetical protein